MLAYLPHGSDQSRVAELLASARTRYQQEALAVREYEQTVLAYRVYLQMPRHHAQTIVDRADTGEPRRSLA